MKKKQLKKLKKNPTGEELLKHHAAIDKNPQDFKIDVFHPWYMGFINKNFYNHE